MCDKHAKRHNLQQYFRLFTDCRSARIQSEMNLGNLSNDRSKKVSNEKNNSTWIKEILMKIIIFWDARNVKLRINLRWICFMWHTQNCRYPIYVKLTETIRGSLKFLQK